MPLKDKFPPLPLDFLCLSWVGGRQLGMVLFLDQLCCQSDYAHNNFRVYNLEEQDWHIHGNFTRHVARVSSIMFGFSSLDSGEVFLQKKGSLNDTTDERWLTKGF